MALVSELAKDFKLMDDSHPADVDLSSNQYCFVDLTGAATGRARVTNVSGQGGKSYAVLLNTPAADETAELRLEGIQKVKCKTAVSAGDELTPADTTGQAETATSGDMVRAIAREGGVAGQCVSARLCEYYKP